MSDEPTHDQPLAQKKTDEKVTAATGASAGVIILQWLTYAFWGWTILSLIWLVYIVLANVMTTADVSGMVPYAIAATLVLLPIAVVCDILYLRHEPAKKHGASMVVMVIHAVIFALFGIGTLITAVLTLVELAIGGSGDHSSQYAWVLTALIGTVAYVLAFLRTLNPIVITRITKLYWLVMTLVVGGFIIAGFVGPVVQARLTQDDRALEDNLNQVMGMVNAKVRANGALPGSLHELSLTAEQKSLADRGLLRYVREGASATGAKYQLCATYKRSSAYYSPNDTTYQEEYSTYIPSTHPAGDVCYKLETTDTGR